MATFTEVKNLNTCTILCGVHRKARYRLLMLHHQQFVAETLVMITKYAIDKTNYDTKFFWKDFCLIKCVSSLPLPYYNMNLQQFLSATEPTSNFFRQWIYFSISKVCKAQEIRDVMSYISILSCIGALWNTEPETVNEPLLLRFIPLQLLCVRTEVLCFWLWTPHCCSSTKSSGLFHSAWASMSSAEQLAENQTSALVL